MNSKQIILMLSGMVFVACLCLGYQLSLRKTLWSDELHTQTHVMEKASWVQIISGKTDEGGNAPLFYLIQKSIVSVAGYHLPFVWYQWSDGRIYHPPSQIVLRVASNVCMSLSLALLFWYFAKNYSLLAAGLSLITSLLSYMVLAFWAEGRPYALWFLLSTIQAIVFLTYSKSQIQLKSFGIIHCLLALTAVTSAGQILLVSGLLWIFGNRKIKDYVFVTGIPLGICFYYFYVATAKGTLYSYRVGDPLRLIHQVFSLDRLVFVILAVGALWILHKTDDIKRIAGIVLGSLGFAIALLMYFKWREVPGFATGLDSRYLIFLTPAGIISTVFCIISVWRTLKNQHANLWMAQFIALIGLGYIAHALWLYWEIHGLALFAYS